MDGWRASKILERTSVRFSSEHWRASSDDLHVIRGLRRAIQSIDVVGKCHHQELSVRGHLPDRPGARPKGACAFWEPVVVIYLVTYGMQLLSLPVTSTGKRLTWIKPTCAKVKLKTNVFVAINDFLWSGAPVIPCKLAPMDEQPLT